jgi:hypothetical protein
MATFHSKYLSDLVLNWLTNGTQMPTPPTQLYLGLLLTMPTKNDGTGAVEVTGGSYARQPITQAQWAAIITNADNLTEQRSTNATITYNPTANWGTIVGVVLSDALTAGNAEVYGTLTAPSAATSGVPFTITAGNLTLIES